MQPSCQNALQHSRCCQIFSIDDEQRVSVIAAASPLHENLNAQSSNDQYLSAVTYSSLASVIKQCDKAARSPTPNATVHARSDGFDRTSNNRNSKNGD